MGKQTVQRFMTINPCVIASSRSLSEAHQLMRARNIRHLPVVEDSKLVGIVSQRDLYLLETLRCVDPVTETVQEAMSAGPFAVRPDALLDDVAEQMAEHKYGCAVVVDNDAVVGVFTTVDALRALAMVLRRGRKQVGAERGGRRAPAALRRDSTLESIRSND